MALTQTCSYRSIRADEGLEIFYPDISSYCYRGTQKYEIRILGANWSGILGVVIPAAGSRFRPAPKGETKSSSNSSIGAPIYVLITRIRNTYLLNLWLNNIFVANKS